jgi:hypothetical protein
VHTAVLINDAGTEIGALRQGINESRTYAPLQLPPWGVFYGFSMVFDRVVLDLIDASRRGGHTFEFTGLLSHDLWVYFLCSSLGRVVVHHQPLAKYRQHDNNQTPHVMGTWFATWKRSLGVAAHPHLRRDEIAAHRAQLMEELSRTGAPGERAAVADRAARYWQRIARHEASRIRLYIQRTALERGARCTKLALSGGYLDHARGGLGWRLFIKDALVGVLQTRRLRSHRSLAD